MNDIDDNIASNAIKQKRKRPIALRVIAAAAAAVLLLTGFQALKRYKHPYESGANGVFIWNVHQFSYNITEKKDLNIPTKDELLESGFIDKDDAEDDDYWFLFEDALPSDVLKLYNFKTITLGNDNFIEQPGEVCAGSMLQDSKGRIDGMYFRYLLTHKKTGVTLCFSCEVYIKKFDMTHRYTDHRPDDRELIFLNDDSMCLLLEHRHNEDLVNSIADFSYDGVIYRIDTPYLNVDKERMKEVLFDLGVL